MESSDLCSYSLRRWGLMLVGIMLVSNCVWAQEVGPELPPAGRYITQVDYPSVRYQGLVASFGNPLREDMKINLMLPPDHQNDPYLCSYPEALNASASVSDVVDFKTRAANISGPVGLLVAVGGPCSTEQKARIMLEMQKAVSQYLKVLILYETDRKYASWFISLAPDSPEAAPELENVGIIYFPFRHIPRMKAQLNSVGKGNPLLLQPDNELWSFEHNIEGFWIPIDPSNAPPPGDYSGFEYETGNDLYWIRYVLFSLLILSPCFRAAYLFHSGGGRFRFRRNDQGRFVGFQYTPPMPYWLSHGRAPQAPEPAARAMTEEQFKTLPEIIYTPMPEEEEEEMDDSDDEAENELIPSDPELGNSLPGEKPEKPSVDKKLPLSKEMGSANDEDLKCGPSESTTSSETVSAPTAAPADAGEQSSSCPIPTACRWSECSICICDFELGELLILLPRCQHVFHKDCIKPWLMERQGRCPLCKTCALGDGSDQQQGDSSEQSESTTLSTGRGSDEPAT